MSDGSVPMFRSVDELVRGRDVLVTGVTGFLGKVWVAMLLDRFEPRRVRVLVRGQRGESAEARFLRIVDTSPVFRPLRAKHGLSLPSFLEDRVRVIDGDVSLPRCGAKEHALRGSVDAVVHFAGLTDFEPDPVKALATNVHGAMHVAELAVSYSAPLIHVSTTFVAGNVSGEIEERIEPHTPAGFEIDPHAEVETLRSLCARHGDSKLRIAAVTERARHLGWPNIYTYTKALAERLIDARRDLRAVIVRPSVVECAQEYPLVGWNEGINTSAPLVWLLSSWFRKLPSQPRHRFDVVPVDRVARSLCVILARALEGTARPVYQLGSSDSNPLTFERAIDLTALAARQYHSRKDASLSERFFLKHLDAVPRGAEVDPFPSLPFLRKVAKGAREGLKKIAPERILPPVVYDQVGEDIDTKLKSLSQGFRNLDRTVGRVEDMLRLYQPFIHDNDYVFRCDAIREENARLGARERDLEFDIASLDWRSYWLEVQVPGLTKWSLPLLRGERVPEDEPTLGLAPPKKAREKTIREHHELAVSPAE